MTTDWLTANWGRWGAHDQRGPLNYVTPALTRAAAGRAFADDYLTLNTHGATHVDSLAHVWWDGRLYNGYDAEEHVTSWDGATRNGIETMGGFATRGVLLDIAGHAGVPHLAHGTRISAADLAATAKAQGLAVRPGDALLVRTGWIRVWGTDRAAFLRDTPGRSPLNPLALA